MTKYMDGTKNILALSQGFLLRSFVLVVNGCTVAFGDETVSASKAQLA